MLESQQKFGFTKDVFFSKNMSLFLFGLATLWIGTTSIWVVVNAEKTDYLALLISLLVLPAILAFVTLFLSLNTLDLKTLKKRKFGGYWKVSLTENRFMKWLIKRRWFQFVLEFPNVLFFTGVMLFGLYGYGGYRQAADAGFLNAATFLTWNIWWVGIIFTFIFAGRLWCTMCPLGCVGEWAHRTNPPPPLSQQPIHHRIIRLTLGTIIGLFAYVLVGTTIGLFTGYPAEQLLGNAQLSDNLLQGLFDYFVFAIQTPVVVTLAILKEIGSSTSLMDVIFRDLWLFISLGALYIGFKFGMQLPEFSYAAVIGTPLQQHKTPKRQYPKFLRSMWITTILFASIMLFDFVVGMFVNPFYTALFVVLLVSLDIILGKVYERRAFCMYVCPLGGLIGVYGMTGMVEIRNKDIRVCSKCRTKDCLKGRTYTEDVNPMTGEPRVLDWPAGYACPMGEFPMVMDSNLGCIQCTECLKSCPNDNISYNIRVPLVDTYAMKKRRFDQAGLAAVLVGLTLAVIMPSVPVVQNALNFALHFKVFGVLQLPEFLVTALWFIFAAFIAPIGGLFLMLILSKYLGQLHDKSLKELFNVFAFAVIPLGLSMHLAFWVVRIFEHLPSVLSVLADPFAGEFMGHKLFTPTGALILTDPITFPVALLYLLNPLFQLGFNTFEAPALLSPDVSFAFRFMAVLLGLSASVYSATRNLALNLNYNKQKTLHILIPVVIWMIFFTAAGLWALSSQF